MVQHSTANPPKSDDRYAQLNRGAFMIDYLLQNPHYCDRDIKSRYFCNPLKVFALNTQSMYLEAG